MLRAEGPWESVKALAQEARRLWDIPATETAIVELGAEVATTPSWASQWRLYTLLVDVLRRDADAYAALATRLQGVGVDRANLPNLENIEDQSPAAGVVAACELANLTFVENPFEAALLRITRDRYAVHAPTAHRSELPGIRGLLAEMRVLAFQADTDTQREVVVKTLEDLATPVLPPVYRLFMAGLVPSAEAGDPEWLVGAFARLRGTFGDRFAPGNRFLGGVPPWAPFLTSIVAPFAFGFLVGPSRVNRRADGQRGGLVVDKCKFLQESNCKGLCLHSCKLPAQQLFDDFGVPLYVKPNFQTQECQWSWGVEAPAPDQDPSWPTGCITSCPTRHLAATPRPFCDA